MRYKTCTHCGKKRLATKKNFYYYANSTTKLRPQCIICNRVACLRRQKARYQKLKHTPHYKEVRNRAIQKYMKKHPEIGRKAGARYYKRHKNDAAYKLRKHRQWLRYKADPNWLSSHPDTHNCS